jgi:hypothetical protein
MHFNLRPRFVPRAALFVCAFVAGATTFAASPDEAPFLAENDTAMAKMMRAMKIEPSGDVDHDFVAMMTPHHQGAIDMAQAELRYGRNEQLRRLAQEIIVTQQQEIAVMRLALAQRAPSPTASVPQQSAPVATGTQSTSYESTHIHPEP